MNVENFVGEPVALLLSSEPFRSWKHEIDASGTSEGRLDYLFVDDGVSVATDDRGLVSAIFLYADEYGGVSPTLFEVPMSADRIAVRARLGRPARSGAGLSDPVLGDHGEWDLFERSGVAIHVEYRPTGEAIAMISLMRREDVPTPTESHSGQPVPSAWRPALSEIALAFSGGDFSLARPIPHVLPVPRASARRWAGYIREYGETLVALPTSSWATSEAHDFGSFWDVFVDLFTRESGRSDLVLHARVRETEEGFEIEVLSVYVP